MSRRRIHPRALSCAVAFALGSAAGLFAESVSDEWPQFRGPNRDGISRESGLLDPWPESGPREVWRVPIGEGFSGISVAQGRIFTMYADVPAEEAASEEALAEEGQVDETPAEDTSSEETSPGEKSAEGAEAEEKPAPKTEYAAAYDLATGKQLWKTAIGARIVTEFGNGPRSTPTVDGDTVFVLGAHGELAALTTANGEKRWEVSLKEEFGTGQPYWGFSTSALVEGDLLLVESGGPEGKSYAGLDKATGKVRWTTGNAPGAGYNSPLALTMNGQRSFVYIAGEEIRAIDAAGKEVWSHAWPPGETHAMPLFIAPDKIFASGTEGVGAALFQIHTEGNKTAVKELWKSRVMRNHFSTSVVHEGYIYGFDNATLKCISIETGEQAWAKRGFGKGSLIYADGHLLVLSDRGKLAQIQASPEAYVEKSRFQALEGLCWTAPTLAGGKLYLRGQNEMTSYDLEG